MESRIGGHSHEEAIKALIGPQSSRVRDAVLAALDSLVEAGVALALGTLSATRLHGRGRYGR